MADRTPEYTQPRLCRAAPVKPSPTGIAMSAHSSAPLAHWFHYRHSYVGALQRVRGASDHMVLAIQNYAVGPWSTEPIGASIKSPLRKAAAGTRTMKTPTPSRTPGAVLIGHPRIEVRTLYLRTLCFRTTVPNLVLEFR